MVTRKIAIALFCVLAAMPVSAQELADYKKDATTLIGVGMCDSDRSSLQVYRVGAGHKAGDVEIVKLIPLSNTEFYAVMKKSGNRYFVEKYEEKQKEGSDEKEMVLKTEELSEAVFIEKVKVESPNFDQLARGFPSDCVLTKMDK